MLLLTGTGLLSQGVGFVYRILLTRLAGAEIMGLYQLILPVYSVLLSLTAAGLYTGVSNLSARYHSLGNRRAIHQVRGQAVGLFLALAVFPCLLLVLLSDGVSVYLLNDARTRLGLMLLVPCLLLTGIENLQKHYFYGTGRILPAAVTELLEQLLRSALVLALLWRLKPATAEGAVGTIVLGMALCEVCAALTQTVLFRLSLGSPGTLTGCAVAPKVLRGQLLSIAIPLGAAALLGNLISSANAVLLPRLLVQGGMTQTEAVSAYGVTFGMTFPMLMLPTAFLSALGLVLTPKLCQAAALGRRKTVRSLIRRAVGGSNLILIPALALLGALGPGIGAALYKEPTVGEYMPLLAAGLLFTCWNSLLSCVLTGLEKQRTAALIALVCDGLQLLLTCLTVVPFGMRGYGWSFTLCALLGAALSWRAVGRETGLSLPVFRWIAGPGLAATLGVLCGRLMETALLRGGMTTLFSAVGGLVFGGLVCLAGLQAMGLLEGEK